uniref:Uncharacterized protein n=1 Tax=Anguilla anguilla TaxID=7936 RepID=A0A0E9QQY4_ANGAN
MGDTQRKGTHTHRVDWHLPTAHEHTHTHRQSKRTGRSR